MTAAAGSPQANGVSQQDNGSKGILDAARLIHEPTRSPRPLPTPDSPELWAQGEATDHMILARYNLANGGWAAPQLVPYGPLSLMPTAAVLHYATECFEGMKLYRGVDGRIRLFRPELNGMRMRQSAARVSLPDFPAEQLVKLIAALAAVDAPRWLPKDRPGTYLYVRPTFIATQPSLAIKKASEALLYIMLVCFPDFDKPTGSLGPPAQGEKVRRPGLRLLASGKDMVRAWPGGFGNCKLGANYGPSIIASAAAAQQGYDQILWLLGDEEWVTEAGACNFFAVVKPKDGLGKTQLLTAPLGNGVVLPGVIRNSVLESVSETFANELDVVERNFSVHELIDAASDGRLMECFVCGTAFFITPVGEISYEGRVIELPVGDERGESQRLVEWLRERLSAIMHGEIEHPWGYVVEEGEVPKQ
ncbi:aminotransferase [Boeremia exigua]|uniref:aminotransferase n=1 Tax=Boeremia exigua TaxID=749465 RepID=UPI001E8CCE2D|nr:aminotransferase [Boeremia exigua]KAH6642800.1 aminotransferase [Boeremia exigua]